MTQVTPQRAAFYQALSFAWQFGYTIALPLVLFGIGGRFLDRKFGTSPWLFLAGVVLSIAISTVALVVKAMKIMRSVEQDGRDQPKSDTTPPAPSAP